MGATWATAAAAFVGVRHVLIHDAWEQDREGVSGIAGATVGCAGTMRHTPHNPGAGIVAPGRSGYRGGSAGIHGGVRGGWFFGSCHHSSSW